MKRHKWMLLAGLAPLFATAGCTAEEVVKSPITVTATKDAPLEMVYFESGKSQLDPKSKEVLQKNVEWLKEHMPAHIQVVGHSDGKGTPEQNLAAGQRRAAAVRDYYVAMGIPRSRIATLSEGQENPLCFEETDDCAANNRRVETLIENKSLASR